MAPVLSERRLNRALLARQYLLEPSRGSPAELVGRLCGMQAQVVSTAPIGLRARLEAEPPRDVVARMAAAGEVVRAMWVRSTLHLVGRDDYIRSRATLQPAQDRALRGFFGNRGAKELDVAALCTEVRPRLTEPVTSGELEALLTDLRPGLAPEMLRYAVRGFLPLVQVPGGGPDGFPSAPRYVLLDGVRADPDPAELVLRYLAAFGPASVKDVQQWSGLTRLAGVLERLRDRLEVFTGEDGRELFDLPDAPRPPADAPAPVRLLPQYDNLVIAHADRRRVLPDPHRPRIALTAGRIRAPFLVDGFVAGAWKLDGGRVSLEPFERLPRPVVAALEAEASRLEDWLVG